MSWSKPKNRGTLVQTLKSRPRTSKVTIAASCEALMGGSRQVVRGRWPVRPGEIYTDTGLAEVRPRSWGWGAAAPQPGGLGAGAPKIRRGGLGGGSPPKEEAL